MKKYCCMIISLIFCISCVTPTRAAFLERVNADTANVVIDVLDDNAFNNFINSLSDGEQFVFNDCKRIYVQYNKDSESCKNTMSLYGVNVIEHDLKEVYKIAVTDKTGNETWRGDIAAGIPVTRNYPCLPLYKFYYYIIEGDLLVLDVNDTECVDELRRLIFNYPAHTLVFAPDTKTGYFMINDLDPLYIDEDFKENAADVHGIENIMQSEGIYDGISSVDYLFPPEGVPFTIAIKTVNNKLYFLQRKTNLYLDQTNPVRGHTKYQWELLDKEQYVEEYANGQRRDLVRPVMYECIFNGSKRYIYTLDINDEIYIKLRDAVYILDETGKHNSINWDGQGNKISVRIGEKYNATGDELSIPVISQQYADKISQRIYINGQVYELPGYNLADNNYIRLKDAEKLFRFSAYPDEPPERWW